MIELLLFFSRLCFSCDVFDDFKAALASPSAFQEALVPSVLNKRISSFHKFAWASCEGLDTMAFSEQGTKAGGPLGTLFLLF